MKTFLDHFAAILSALTVGLLLTSVVHEYGYFLVIGTNFQALLTTSDYLASAVWWLPPVLSYAIIADWKLEDSSPGKVPWKHWRTWLAIFALASIAFGIIFSPWPPSLLSVLVFMLLAMLAWFALYKRSALYQRWYRAFEEQDDLNSIFLRLLKFGPPFLALVFLWGWIQGSNDANSTSDPYLVKFKDRDQAESRILLKNFERGLLMRNAASKRIEFHKWDEVVALEKMPNAKSESLACLFGLAAACDD
jgi:hypothetical protein